MKTVSINLYSFSELNEGAAEKAINEQLEFLTKYSEHFLTKYGEYTEGYTRGDIIDNIEANKYLFFKDGSLAHCTTYTPTNKTTFHFHGNDYAI